jgi:hypothetical protein
VTDAPPPRPLTRDEARSRKSRNIAIALAVTCFVVLIYAVTIAKLGPGVLDRPL